MDMRQSLQQLSPQWAATDPLTQFETPETVRLDDGSLGVLTEFTACLESDGRWRFKSRYRSGTGASRVRVNIRRTM